MSDNIVPLPVSPQETGLTAAMERHPAGKGRVNPVFLSRAIICPLCEQPVHDGDHEELFTRDRDGNEQSIMIGHRTCITAEVERRNGAGS